MRVKSSCFFKQIIGFVSNARQFVVKKIYLGTQVSTVNLVKHDDIMVSVLADGSPETNTSKSVFAEPFEVFVEMLRTVLAIPLTLHCSLNIITSQDKFKSQKILDSEFYNNYNTNMSSKVKEKRINSEITMLDKLPEGYLVQYREGDGCLRVDLEIDRKLVKSELLPDNINAFNFSIICDTEFPFKGPQVQCNTNFLQMSICDQRDLFVNICRTKWAPSNTLYEITKLIPEFISDAVISEASEERKFIGRFNLGQEYYIGDYYGIFDVWKFKDRHNIFIDYTIPKTDQQHKSQSRYLVVTDTGLMVCDPDTSDKDFAVCRGWNTLYKLHKVRREKDNPKVISFVWDDDMMMEWTLTFDDQDQFINSILFKMEALGCKYQRKEYVKKMILENEVTKAGFLKNMDFRSHEIVDLIAIYEEAVNSQLTIENINALTSLYQKAIEYYSAQDSTRYEDFLNRNRILLQREDVQAVLMSLEAESEEAKQLHNQPQLHSINPTFEHQIQQDPSGHEDHFIIGSEDSESEKGVSDINLDAVPIEEKKAENSDGEEEQNSSNLLPGETPEKHIEDYLEESKEQEVFALEDCLDDPEKSPSDPRQNAEDQLVDKFNSMNVEEDKKLDDDNEEDANSEEGLVDFSSPEDPAKIEDNDSSGDGQKEKVAQEDEDLFRIDD